MTDTYSPGEREHKEFSYQGVLMPGFVMLLGSLTLPKRY